VPALHDILAASDTEAREFQLALTRGDIHAARYWFECEWSFRAKEQFRGDIEARQSKACACCGLEGVRLQLNHRTKVRAWGGHRWITWRRYVSIATGTSIVTADAVARVKWSRVAVAGDDGTTWGSEGRVLPSASGGSERAAATDLDDSRPIL